jgi:DNA invertase Pin-like site-specific DNA recombinase
MAMSGYARASAEDQDTSIQEDALRAAGCAVIKAEKQSGTSLKGRDQLETILEFIAEGDVLTVTRVDRLARSVADVEKIVAQLRAKGAHLRATEQNIDTSTAEGTAFLQMLAVFAQFETAIRRERQAEGIAKAKASGVYRGRKATIGAAEVRRLRAEGLGATAIAVKLVISRASVYRLLGESSPV